MNKGVLLIAFGKPSYAYFAYNMAVSIKHHSPDVRVCLASDGVEKYLRPEQLKVFDHIKHFTPVRDAGHNKLRMFELSPFDHTLFLDVDGCAVADVAKLIDTYIEDGRPVIGDVVGSGGLRDNIEYQFWTRNYSLWGWFGLPYSAKVQTLQTSSMYFDKSAKSKEFFDTAQRFKNFPHQLLVNHWGGATPDELIFTGAAARTGLDLKHTQRPVFFGHKHYREVTDSNISEKHYVLSMYGNARLVKLRFREMYDRKMKKYSQSAYSSHLCYTSKHIR